MPALGHSEPKGSGTQKQTRAVESYSALAYEGEQETKAAGEDGGALLAKLFCGSHTGGKAGPGKTQSLVYLERGKARQRVAWPQGQPQPSEGISRRSA